jgi:hypothetical protein
MQAVYELTSVIADVISAHCPGTSARERFMHACLRGAWDEARGMIEGIACRALASERVSGKPASRFPRIATKRSEHSKLRAQEVRTVQRSKRLLFEIRMTLSFSYVIAMH